MSPISSLWFKWKSLHLPWRRMFLIGKDLGGNTFWEFKDQNNAGRFRRIVKYNPKTHLADVKVSPQWHQWLRQVRPEAPTIEEQQNELLRQERMKHLAQLADERWENKPSYLDKPQEHKAGPALQSHNPSYHAGGSSKTKDQAAAGEHNAVGTEEEVEVQGQKVKQGRRSDKNKDPWSKAATGGPGENWQPEAWNPTASKK